jgi:hypothetical protein
VSLAALPAPWLVLGGTGITEDGPVLVATPASPALRVGVPPPLELELPPNSPLTSACPWAAMTIPSGRQALLDAMEPQADGTPPMLAKSKQLQPGRQVWHGPQAAPAGQGPQAQSTSVGRHNIVGVVSQVGGGAQVSFAAQAPLEPQLDSPTFTHW